MIQEMNFESFFHEVDDSCDWELYEPFMEFERFRVASKKIRCQKDIVIERIWIIYNKELIIRVWTSDQ